MADIEYLVPDPLVAEEFSVTLMTIWRWDQDDAKRALGWPPKIKIGTRNYRNRSKLEAFKDNVLRRALDERDLGGGESGRTFDKVVSCRHPFAREHWLLTLENTIDIA